jgi:hypothetical protein
MPLTYSPHTSILKITRHISTQIIHIEMSLTFPILLSQKVLPRVVASTIFPYINEYNTVQGIARWTKVVVGKANG